MDNRWTGLVSPARTQAQLVFEEVAEETVELLRGASSPQPGVRGVEDGGRLGRFLTEAQDVFWLGAHGGAGETVLAELLGGTACHHRWPMRSTENYGQAPATVFLIARQNMRGLEAASRAARDWASGAHHGHVQLAGLVLMADAPGRTPRPLAGQTRVVSGGVPRTWVVPWIEELRLTGTVDWESMAREPRKVLTALGEAVNEVISERTPQ